MRGNAVPRELCDDGRALLDVADVIVWEATPSPLRLSCVGGGGFVVLGLRRKAWLEKNGVGPILMPADDVAQLEAVCSAVIADGKVRRLEHRLYDAENHGVWYRSTVSACFRKAKARVIGTSVEISDYKDAESAALQLEHRLRIVLDHAPVILWSTTADGTITMAEGRGLCELGLRTEELVGASILEVGRGEPDVEAALSRAFGGEIVSGALRFHERDYETYISPVRGESDTITSVVGVSLDTTEAARASRVRDEAELRLRTVLQHAPMILWAVDRNGRVTLSEGKGLEALGVRPGQLVGTNARDFDPRHEITWLSRVLAGEPYSGESYYAHGSLWYETRCETLFDKEGKTDGALVVSIDVTARKRTEIERDRLLAEERAARQEAEAARRHCAFLADAGRVLAGSLDRDTTLEAIARLVVPEIADGCVVDLLDQEEGHRPVVAYRDPAKEPEIIALSRRIGVGPGTPTALVAASAEPFFVPALEPADLGQAVDPESLDAFFRTLGVASIVAVPMKVRGRTLGVISFFTVAESGRRLGEEHVALATDLAVHASLAVHNARLYREQTEAVHRRDEFLSVASHELRTPVTSLQLAVQSLLRMRQRANEAGVSTIPTSLLETAERQSQRLTRLVDSLLDVSRIAIGQLTLEFDRIDLAEAVREIATNLSAEMTQAGCRLELSLDSGLVGRWDRVRLEQIVTNLLSNALKYGAGKPVSVSVTRDGSAAELTVEDRGIGIPYERQAAIFDRFERAVSAKHYSGFGLGLYIAKQIVNAHGGSISVESEPGRGATFRVSLPLDELA